MIIDTPSKADYTRANLPWLHRFYRTSLTSRAGLPGKEALDGTLPVSGILYQ
jgi:hypothetical protein